MNTVKPASMCLFFQDWKKRIELKIAFYQCITHYYMGKQSEDQQKWGERLAYYQASQEKLNESVKLAKVSSSLYLCQLDLSQFTNFSATLKF